MAIESVEANAGSGGATFAVDTITGSVQVPYVKLMSGADASENLIAGDATNGLDVDVTRVSGTVTVDGSGVTQPVSHAALTELAAAINASSQMDVNIAASNATVAVSNAGLTELAAAINASSQMDINIAASNATLTVASHAVTNAGTFATQVDGAALTALQLIDNAVVDHGSAAVAGVRPVGLEGRSTAPTAVDSGDAVRALATLLGKQVVYPYAIPAETWSYASPAAVADTNDDEAKAAGAAGIRHYITGVQVFNADDTVGTEVVIKDGTTVMWRGWCEQTGGGCSARFDPPLRGTAATAVNVANITTSAETYFNLQGFSALE